MITNKFKWIAYKLANKNDTYGQACIDCAERIMEFLDNRPWLTLNPGYYPDLTTPHGMICHFGDNLSGFQAGAVAEMISNCHERGAEFRKMVDETVKMSKHYK